MKIVFRIGVILCIITSMMAGNSLVSSSSVQEIKNSKPFSFAYASSFADEKEIIINRTVAGFDGTFDYSKSVDADMDGVFDDENTTVDANDILTYKINWKFNQGLDLLDDAYVYDIIPEGTTYIGGTAFPTGNLSYSLNNGTTWIPGEPPHASPAGTRLRWGEILPYWSNIQGEVFTPSPDNAIVSPKAVQPSLVIDKYDSPHVSCADYAKSDVEFDIIETRWDGSKWIGENGLPYSPATATNVGVSVLSTDSDGPSLAVDSNGYPAVAWGEKVNPNRVDSWELFFAKWNGSNWVNAQGDVLSGFNANISNTYSTSYGASLALDSNDMPHVAWYEYMGASGSFEIFYVRWNGTNWVNVSDVVYNGTNANVSNTVSSSEFPCLKLDGNDRPCITWSEGSFGGYDELFVRWNGAQWVGANGLPYNPATGANANVSQNTGYSSYPNLDLDLLGNPCISWHDYTYGGTSIMCVAWDGSQWIGGNGLPYNNVTGANGIVANGLYIPNGTTANRLAAKLTSVEVDSTGAINLAFWANIAGNKGVYYIKSDGSGWFGLNNLAFDSATGANGYTQAGWDSVYTNYATALELALNSQNIPHIVWYMETVDRVTSSLIKYVPITQERTFSFSTRVDRNIEHSTLTTISNQAFFSHAQDSGVQIESNNVDVILKIPAPSTNLVVTKTSKTFEYNVSDIMEFTIVVKNSGSLDAESVTLADAFPKELVFISAIPSGTVGTSRVLFNIGKLVPGASEIFKLKFKLSSKASIDDCATITNEAIASSSAQTVRDAAVFKVCTKKAPDPLSLEIIWNGIDVKTNIGRVNSPVYPIITPKGGSAPYDVTIDWGNGDKTVLSSRNEEKNIPVAVYEYKEAGFYTIIITCADAYGSTRIIKRKVEII